MNILDRRVSWGSVLGLLLSALKWAAIMVAGMATWAQVRSAPIDQPVLSDWLFWTLVISAIVAAWDPGLWLRNRAKHLLNIESRSNATTHALQQLRSVVSIKKRPATFQEVVESLLQAAEIDLRSVLHLTDESMLKTNLVLALPPDSFQVAARSRAGSALHVKYKLESPIGAVTRALQENKTAVASDIEHADGQGKRAYRSVVATPMCEGRRAFGAITADSRHPKTFKGKEVLIDQILRPYAAAILLALPNESPHFDCPERFE